MNTVGECPQCKQADHLYPAKFNDRSELAFFLFGGLFSYLLHRESHKNLLFCEKCGLVFTPNVERKRKRSWIAAIILIFFALIVFYLAWSFAESSAGR